MLKIKKIKNKCKKIQKNLIESFREKTMIKIKSKHLYSAKGLKKMHKKCIITDF